MTQLQPLGSITRKSLLRPTQVDFGDYAVNYVEGCSHGCKYPCYAYLQKRRFGQVKSYEEWLQPKIVSNTLELLDKELARIEKKRPPVKSVHLCFTTDPFMYGYPEIHQLSIEVIKRINAKFIPCTVLTKGILPLELKDLSSYNEYGISLVTLDDDYRKQTEPGASSIEGRLSALKALSKVGCKTWVSIEPYPTPNIFEQDLDRILQAVGFVDRIVFGRLNYSKLTSRYPTAKSFYNDCAKKVRSFCTERGIRAFIKKGTETADSIKESGKSIKYE